MDDISASKAPTPEEMAFAKAGLDAEAPPVEPEEMPSFVSVASTDVDLSDPIKFAGREFHRIRIENPTLKKIVSHVRGGGAADTLSLPIFTTEAGEPVPQLVMDALSSRDGSEVREAAESFLSKKSPAVEASTAT